MGKRARSIRSECEMVSKKVEKGTYFRELSSKASMGLWVQIRKTATSRRPNLMLEEKQTKTMWLCDMACLQVDNIENKRLEKRTKYRKLAFEIREKWPGFKVKVAPLVISVFGGGFKEMLKELENIYEKDDLCERIGAEMQKTILMDSETIIRKVLSGLVQREWINLW